MSNLDAKLRASAREELELFHKRVGTTTIYVTHDQVEAMAMGDRVMVLHKGYVRQLGTPREVYDTPADTFVATFLGSPPMNLLENGDFIVGFRPEHLLPVELAAHSAITFRLKVKITEYLGAEWILYGTPVGGKFEGKEVVSRLASAASFKPDQVYDFGVREADLHFFDRKSEKRTHSKVLEWQ